jgi:hypothetical protein
MIILVLLLLNAVLCQDCYLNKTKDLLDNDFGKIWIDQTFQGVIGTENLRIQIRFLAIQQDSSSKNVYHIIGKSKVNDNICDFRGQITVTDIDTLNSKCDGPVPDGLIAGSYEFWEDSTQNHVGRFSGLFKSQWQVRDGDFIPFVGWYTDNEVNVFKGQWQEYGKSRSLLCSWGKRVPPEFKDELFPYLENGFFGFNPEYIDKGWRSFVMANSGFIFFAGRSEYSEQEKKEARAIEAIEWWR